MRNIEKAVFFDDGNIEYFKGCEALLMTQIPEFWNEINDLPRALLILANGGSLDEVERAFFDGGYDDAEIEPARRRARRHLKSLIDGKHDQVGKWAVKRLLKARMAFEAYYTWDNGLSLRSEGSLDTDASLDLSATYATARLADLVARDRVILCTCFGCGNYAIKDKRGSGISTNKNWCSTRCRTAHAQKEKRRRDRIAKAYQKASGSG